MIENKKIALVTGASRGIGEAIAKKLAQNGFFIIGTAIDENGAECISEFLADCGVGLVLDVNFNPQIEQLIKKINQNYGEISVLVNNAGITKDGLLMRMKEEDFDAVINTNLKSIFLMSKAVVRGMMKARFGRIINIASVVGFMGNPGQVNYVASKGGMVAMTKSLAKELGSRNITANCVAPGFIKSDMTDKLPEEVKAQYLQNIALGEFGRPEDIANAVNFLASEDASYITGSTIHVNGGLYM